MGETLGEYFWNARFGIAILIIIGLIIVLYHQFLRARYKNKYIEKDFLNRTHCKSDSPFDYCSGWALLHFLLYLIIGLLWPANWELWLLIGILWEILEWAYGKYSAKNNPDQKINARVDQDGNVTYREGWWAGNGKDLVANVLGLFTGVFLARVFYPERLPCYKYF